jgi:Protein-tyrosine phosphatase
MRVEVTMTAVSLPDGVLVNARSLGSPRPRPQPDYGVYLCARRARRRRARQWTGTWRTRWLDWPPLGVPRDSASAVDALREAYRRAARGERVEVACGSGRSRTSTALAALAVCTGLEADAAISWVKQSYPPARLFTRGQRRWLDSVAPALHR